MREKNSVSNKLPLKSKTAKLLTLFAVSFRRFSANRSDPQSVGPFWKFVVVVTRFLKKFIWNTSKIHDLNATKRLKNVGSTLEFTRRPVCFRFCSRTGHSINFRVVWVGRLFTVLYFINPIINLYGWKYYASNSLVSKIDRPFQNGILSDARGRRGRFSFAGRLGIILFWFDSIVNVR